MYSVANEERLGIELYMADGGFTKGIKKAQQETSRLTQATSSLVPAVVSAEKGLASATKSIIGVAEATKKTESELVKLKRAGDGVAITIKADDKATSKVKQVKEELNGIKGRVYTATVNVKQNLSGMASGAANKLSGAMFGATAQMAGMAGIGFGVFDAVKGYADFEEEMSAVKAISGATGDEFARLNEKAIQMGADTKYSALESAQAFRYMGMAGWKSSEMIDGIGGIMSLAAASGEDLASVSDIVTDSLTAFNLKAKDSAMFSDVLAAAATNSNTSVALMGQTFKYAAPVAGALGYSVQDVAQAVGLMANAGIKGSEAGTSLRGLLTRLVKPTKESGEAMDILGLSITDANGKMKPFNQVIKDIRQGMSRLTPESKASLAAMLAGQEGMSGLLALVNASDSDFNKLADAIANSNGAAEHMASIRMDNLKGDLEQLSGDWDSFTTKIMGGSIGGFRDIVQGVDNWFAGFSENVEKNGLNVHSILDGTTSAVKELIKQTLKMDGLPSILSAAALAVGGVGLLKGAKKARGLLGKWKNHNGNSQESGIGYDSTGEMTVNAMTVTLYASQLLPGNGASMGPTTGRGKGGAVVQGATIDSPVKGAKGGKWGGRIGSIGRGIGKGVGGLGRGLMKLGGKAAIPVSLAMGAYDVATSDNKGQAVSGLGGSLAGGLAGAKLGAMGGAALGSVIPGVGTAVGGAVGGLLGGIGGAVFGEELGQQIYDGITSNLDGLTAWFGETWNSIKEYASDAMEELPSVFTGAWQAVVDTCAPIINTFVGIYTLVWDAIATIFEPVAQWFDTTVWQPTKEFANTAITAVTGFFNGLWSDIQSVWSGVANWFDANVWQPTKEFANTAINSITDFFSNAWENIKSVWSGVANWFDANVWGPLKKTASSVFASIGNALGAAERRGVQVTGIGGTHTKSIDANATGTNYFGGGWTQINERGGEIVDLPQGSRIYPAATTRKMIANQLSEGASGGNSYSISGNTFVVREEADMDRIAHTIFSLFRDAEVNYGGV